MTIIMKTNPYAFIASVQILLELSALTHFESTRVFLIGALNITFALTFHERGASPGFL